MRPLNLPLALCLSLLAACSTTQPSAPAKVDPPPVKATEACLTPADLAEGASAQDLAAWARQWVAVAGCELAKRLALIEAWPK